MLGAQNEKSRTRRLSSRPIGLDYIEPIIIGMPPHIIMHGMP